MNENIGVSTEQRRRIANIKMWLIRLYMNDLSGYYAGDAGFFGRQVVDGGQPLPSAHPAGWAQHVINCTTPETVEFYAAEIEAVYSQLASWKLAAEPCVSWEAGAHDDRVGHCAGIGNKRQRDRDRG